MATAVGNQDGSGRVESSNYFIFWRVGSVQVRNVTGRIGLGHKNGPADNSVKSLTVCGML